MKNIKNWIKNIQTARYFCDHPNIKIYSGSIL